MLHPRAIKASYKNPYSIIILFQNGEEKLFDYTEYLQYPAYHILRDENISQQVQVKNGVICWDDQVDFDPDIVYEESVNLFTNSI